MKARNQASFTYRRGRKRVKRIGRRLLGTGLGDRRYIPRPDDVMLVSYPRSGNTWARFLIGNLLRPEDPVSFINLEERVPDIYVSTRRKIEQLPSPRVIKSHECFQPRYKRVLYIVRDPRDVALSYYHHLIKVRRIDDGYPFEAYIKAFLEGSLNRFGTWAQNVGSWLGAREGDENFFLLRYESLTEDQQHWLGLVASFLNIDADESRLREAISRSSAGQMRRLEREAGASWKRMKRSRLAEPFIRTASIGAGKAELPAEAVAAIEARWRIYMSRLGYLDRVESDRSEEHPRVTGVSDADAAKTWF